MSSRGEYVLRAEGLTKVFQPPAGLRRLLMRSPIVQPITAVNDVNIEVQRGEVFGLLGPNGAGKTTLIKMLTTLLQPTTGNAMVCGFDTVRQERQVRERIGTTIGEERSFFWRLTGRQNLAFFASLQNLPKRDACKRIEEVLALMGLENDGDNMFYSYSSGMKQKLSIARSLLSEPEVLFLDEPTKNVDALTASDLKELIKAKLSGDSGRTVLLATHRMEEAEQLCDRIAIVRSGSILFCGTVPELRTLLGKPEECVLRLSGIDSRACTFLAARHQLTNSAVERPSGNGLVEMRFSLPPDGAQLSSLLLEVLSSGGKVLSMDTRERSLEDLFLNIVGREARAS